MNSTMGASAALPMFGRTTVAAVAATTPRNASEWATAALAFTTWQTLSLERSRRTASPSPRTRPNTPSDTHVALWRRRRRLPPLDMSYPVVRGARCAGAGHAAHVCARQSTPRYFCLGVLSPCPHRAPTWERLMLHPHSRFAYKCQRTTPGCIDHGARCTACPMSRSTSRLWYSIPSRCQG